MHLNMIPIVHGATLKNIHRVSPPRSIIQVDFLKLIENLVEIASNPELALEFFVRKQFSKFLLPKLFTVDRKN
ncbi:hypothetical protein Ciccas_009909 [Cichlidogyrus casuarinus]|uniref:Uncharacterized protein n=1 Tax=Cichlidogyrus casuarinus TaxID=1844966 RepID=A0ABD2PVP7_9PLAT